MNNVRMTRLRHSALSLSLLIVWAGCATLPSPPVMTNVPSDRLDYEAYTSPDGGFSITLSHLNAGANVEEHQVGLDKRGVRFSDGPGRAYRIIRIDNTDAKFTLEQISDQSKSR